MTTRTALAAVLAIGVLAGSLAADAEQPTKVFRIGILANVPLSDPEGARLWGAFIQGLRELGYVEGQNVTIEWRVSQGRYERLPDLAADLVRRKVDVIVAPAIQNVRAAKQATRTIPIIMTSAGDPVTSGLVASLARPGGNVTGVSTLGPEVVAKQLELLKEMVPQLSRVAVLANPANQGHALLLREAEATARSLRVRLQTVEVRRPADFEKAFVAMTSERAGALLILADGMFILHRTRLADLATKSHLPAMYGLREYGDAGGLVVYAPSLRESFRHAATYVDKVLKGAKPADLPIEQPTKFDLTINLKTAKALGLAIPPSVLLRADEVIE